MLNAINNIPKPNLLVYLELKSELSGPTPSQTQICNSPTDMLNVFKVRLKEDKEKEKENNNAQKVKLEKENQYNYIGKPRHYAPASQE